MAKSSRRSSARGKRQARAPAKPAQAAAVPAGGQILAPGGVLRPWRSAQVPLQLIERSWRQEAAPLLTVFLAAFLLYALTAPRTVTLEDDGLFLMNLATWGVCHPPGYPLYSLLGSSFYHLLPDFIAPALRGHLFSGFCAALACAAIYAIVVQLVRSRWAGVIAGLALAASDAFWSQAIIAEVYALGAALYFALIAMCMRYAAHDPSSSTGKRTHLLLHAAIAFAYGLGLSNHWPLLGLGSVGLLLMVLSQRRALLRHLPVGVLCLALGLLPYAYVVLRSQTDAALNFYGPIDTFESLRFYVTRGGYSGVDRQAGVGLDDKIAFVSFLLAQTVRQFTIAGLLIAIAGCIAMLRSRAHSWLACCLLVAWFMTGPLLLALLDFQQSPLAFAVFRVYHLLSYGILAIWIGYGLAWLAEWLRSRTSLREHAAPAAALLGSLAVVAAIAINWQRNDRSDYAWARDHAMLRLVSVDQNADLFTFDDLDIPVGYLSYVEGVRPDVTVYNDQGLIYGNRLYSPLLTDDRKAALLARHAATTSNPVYYSTIRTNLFAEAGSSDFLGLWRRANPGGDADRLFLTDQFLHWLEHALDQAPAIEEGWTRKQNFDAVGNLVSGLARVLSSGNSIGPQWDAMIERAMAENGLAHVAVLSATLDGDDFTADRAREELAWVEQQLAAEQRDRSPLDNSNYADMLAVAARIALRFPEAVEGSVSAYVESSLVRSIDFKPKEYNVQFLADVYRSQARYDDALAMLADGYPRISSAPPHIRALYSQIAREKASGRLEGPVLKLPN